MSCQLRQFGSRSQLSNERPDAIHETPEALPSGLVVAGNYHFKDAEILHVLLDLLSPFLRHGV